MSLIPSPQQEAILDFLRSSTEHLSVRALAGTGKTSTIVLANALCPKPPLNIAFNALIRREFKERLPQAINHTFNSFGHNVLVNNLRSVNFNEDKLRNYLNDRGFDYKDSPDGLAAVNWLRNQGWAPTEHALRRSDAPNAVAEMAAVMSEEEFEVSDKFIDALPTTLLDLLKLAVQGDIDYGDQVWLPVVLNLSLGFPFGTVFVDEAQDINALQHSLIIRLARMNRVVIVGDPHQAIYGFRGSVGEGMSILERDLKATALPLSVTWRCAKSIVEYAQQFVPEYEAAPDAPQGEVNHLDEWDISREVFPPNTAVVCRNNAPLLSLAMALISQHIPCAVRGTDIGKNLTRLANKIIKERRVYTTEALERAIREWAAAEAAAKPKKAERTYERRDCLLAVLASCQGISQFLDTLRNIFSDNKASITLSTIHKAKGLEWERVMFLDRWRIPSRYATSEEELQQEDNLVYVGATRAKRELTFISNEQ